MSPQAESIPPSRFLRSVGAALSEKGGDAEAMIQAHLNQERV